LQRAALEELARRALRPSPRIDYTAPADWFHKGQKGAWEAHCRVLLLLWGNQSGKTIFGPHWLLREIQNTAKAGEANDYLLAGPTIELLKKKAIPELQKALNGLAVYNQGDRCFRFTAEGSAKVCGRSCQITVFVGYAAKPESLESATYKAAWLDEAGQKEFKEGSWEAILRRLTIHQGRVLITTTPYQLGWLQKRIYNQDGKGEVTVIPFESRENPAYPIEEWNRAQQDLPPYRFDLFYRGIFTKPSGAVFDCFESKIHVKKLDLYESGLNRWTGHDFGTANTAAVMVEERRDGTLYVYESFHGGNRTVGDYVKRFLHKVGGVARLAGSCGGSWSEDEWRALFDAEGLSIERNIYKDVSSRILCLYREIKLKRIFFAPELTELIDEIEDYQYHLDDSGESTDEIEDKAKYHRLDALAAIVARLRPLESKPTVNDTGWHRQKTIEKKLDPDFD